MQSLKCNEHGRIECARWYPLNTLDGNLVHFGVGNYSNAQSFHDSYALIAASGIASLLREVLKKKCGPLCIEMRQIFDIQIHTLNWITWFPIVSVLEVSLLILVYESSIVACLNRFSIDMMMPMLNQVYFYLIWIII